MRVYVDKNSDNKASIHYTLDFLHIKYELYSQDETTEQRAHGLYLNDVPTPIMFKHLYEKPLVSFESPRGSYVSNNPIETILLETGDPDLFNYIGRIDTIELYWMMIKKYWYEVSETWVKSVITPNWLYSIQKECLIKNKRVDDFDWVNSQAFFSRPYQRIILEGTLDDAITDFIKSDPSSSIGKEYIIKDFPKHRLHRHPLTLPGVVTIRYHENNETVDTSITIVTHFYNLKLSNKPLDSYMKSLEYFAKILHPIIFYGDLDITQEFIKLREEEGMKDYTTVIQGVPQDWKIYNSEYPYETITCLKPYIIEDAMKRNPYISDNWVYMDCGTYKYTEFPYMNTAIFNRVPFNDKLRVWGMTSIPVTSDLLTSQAMIASIIMGSRKAWDNFNKVYFQLLDIQEIINKAEQYYMTRIITLKPHLFDIVVSTLHEEAYAKLLNLE